MSKLSKGKTIRDVIHGDIFLPPQYVALIDTAEFQRLRRIKQLSVANMAFPGADHTRFVHCIGTFYIMGKIIEHFDAIFRELSLNVLTDVDKDAALAAALLHDIGHGPFSHAFEKVLKTQGGNDIRHEVMSTRIIKDESTQIHQALVKHFGLDFPNRVSNIILKKKEVKESRFDNYTDNPDLTFILSSLLSSQLDADRMDYLLRDARYTGAEYGTIDLSRTIESLTLAYDKSNQQYCVCIKERYLSDVENCLISRYQMHKEVYYHKLKCEMELVIDKILFRARELFLKDELEGMSYLPDALRTLFRGAPLPINEFISLDDSILYSQFVIWSRSADVDLSTMCRTILWREKYHRLSIEESEKIKRYKRDILAIFKKHKIEIELEKEAFLLESEDKLSMYKAKTENIFVLNRYGVREDILDVSHLLDFKRSTIEKSTVFINYNLINAKFESTSLVGELEAIEKKYESRNQIEKEAKYIISNEKQWDDIKEAILTMNGYEIMEGDKKEQEDIYFDTTDKKLETKGITLRIRTRGNRYTCTIKKPVLDSEDNETAHSARYEYEQEIESNTLELCADFIIENLACMQNVKTEEFQKTLVVKNKRKKFDITEKTNSSIKFEMVFDDVVFYNPLTQKEATDLQMEIELKSDFLHEVNLSFLTRKLEQQIKDLSTNTISKYQRGLKLTQYK